MGSEQERERERGHFARRREGNTLLLLGERERERERESEGQHPGERAGIRNAVPGTVPGTEICDGTSTALTGSWNSERTAGAEAAAAAVAEIVK